MAEVSEPAGHEPRVLRVGELDIGVKVSTRRRTLGLTVERDSTITATVPPGVDDAAVARLVMKKQPWIYAKLRERAELGQPSPREFVAGEGFPYLGRSYRLLLVDDAPAPVALNEHSRRLELRRDCADDAERHLIGWYRERGQQRLPPRAAPWAQRMAVKMTGMRVRPLGYRWGSCSANGLINIHWAVMQLGLDLIDYVLVHELAHLNHRNHDAGFWAAVLRCMPDQAARRARLRHMAPELWLPEPDPQPVGEL